MSEQSLNAVVQENVALKQQIEQFKNNATSLAAQVDAHKGMLNENIQSGLNLRTALIMFQKANQELNDKTINLEKTITSLTQQLADANAKIAPVEPTADAA